MKANLSAVLVLGLCGLAVAADEKADPVGTWKCEYDIGGHASLLASLRVRGQRWS